MPVLGCVHDAKSKLACSPSSSVRGPTQTSLRIRTHLGIRSHGCTPGLSLSLLASVSLHII